MNKIVGCPAVRCVLFFSLGVVMLFMSGCSTPKTDSALIGFSVDGKAVELSGTDMLSVACFKVSSKFTVEGNGVPCIVYFKKSSLPKLKALAEAQQGKQFVMTTGETVLGRFPINKAFSLGTLTCLIDKDKLPFLKKVVQDAGVQFVEDVAAADEIAAEEKEIRQMMEDIQKDISVKP